ncbi:receptor-like protein kinase FERONIA [Euphorbia lathyris]|uniref:receptor-like protein kinase FERONIA n=1 Tax=Euphorbia lathyris TaxID=212925 RepID=UPI00331334B2
MIRWIFKVLCCYLLFDSIICAFDNSSLDKIILNCGSAEFVSFNGKYWSGDVDLKFIPAEYARRTVSMASTSMSDDVPNIPYSTARVFHFQFAYSFPMSPGFKFIRLHFYPTTYSGIGGSSRKVSFSVFSGQYRLLSNFNPSAMANTLKVTYFTKDFVVNSKEKVLNISFIPFPEAYGFVNGIEIYSFPSNFRNYSRKEAAFEMVHRVKVGRSNEVQSSLWDWSDDSSYILGSMSGSSIYTQEETQDPWTDMSDYSAPISLYAAAKTMGSDEAINMMYNLTWKFNVDPGFNYLVRLHFCEISYEVKQLNQRVFTVYINNQTVEKRLDVIALAGAPLVGAFRDYLVFVPKEKGERQELLLALHPNIESNPLFKNAILNGVEIMKLSDEHNNLAAEVLQIVGKRKIPIRLMIFGGLGGISMLCLILGTWLKLNSIHSIVPKLQFKSSTMPMESLSLSGLCCEFKLADIKAATTNFTEAMVIGVGGFGKVYKGSIFINGGATEVAIKRKHLQSNQGIHEFQTEINLLSTFRHTNLVSLHGFCREKEELILVYDYMSHGTLRDNLLLKNSPLTWIQRLKICIGAARGLHYLHTGTKHPIIHRDIKSTNILLDSELVAKVSDFGLSRIGPTTASTSHVKTEVKGTFGYLDPVYYRNRTLSKKSDVYSFGVVLFEVLCARPAVHPAPMEEANDGFISLAEWALRCHKSGDVDSIVDPFLAGKIAPQSLVIFIEIAVKCLAEKRTQRPTMGVVLHNLELALYLQEQEVEDITNQ